MNAEKAQEAFSQGYYGQPIMGSWFCTEKGCEHAWKEHFPLRMRDAGLEKPFKCPNGHTLEYDEAA